MYCIRCGQQLPDDAKFCSKCGAQVGDSLPISRPIIDGDEVKMKAKEIVITEPEKPVPNIEEHEPTIVFQHKNTIYENIKDFMRDSGWEIMAMLFGLILWFIFRKFGICR